MRTLFFCTLLFLSACGYHFDNHEKIAICVPYVVGDYEGELTDALARAISRTPNFRYASGEGDWILKAKITQVENQRIGFRYDLDPKNGKLRDNIIGTENRKEIFVEFSVISAATGKLVVGPQTIRGQADYDYVDPNSLQDVSFIDPATGTRVTSIAFSLGQLDSVGTAGEDAIYPIYDRLAQTIVDGVLATGGPDGE